MDNNIISSNLTFLRLKHNLSFEKVAEICGISTTDYKKIETGFETPSFEVLDKLAEFYQVDIGVLSNNLLQDETKSNATNLNNSSDSSNETSNSNGRSETSKRDSIYENKKWLSGLEFAGDIVSLVAGVGLLGVYLFVAIVKNYSVSFLGAEFSGSIYLYNLFAVPDVLACLLGLFGFLVPTWLVVNSIIMLCSKNLKFGKYRFVSSIITIASTGLVGLLAIEIVKDVATTSPLLFLIIPLVLCIFNAIILFLKLFKIKEQKGEAPKFILMFEILCLAIIVVLLALFFTLPMFFNGISYDSMVEVIENSWGVYQLYNIMFSIMVLAFAVYEFVNEILMIVSSAIKGSKYGFISKIIQVASFGIVLIFSLVVFAFEEITPIEILFVFVIMATLLLNVLSLINHKKQRKAKSESIG